MPQMHIDEVYSKDTVCPIIVNFQNGYPTEEFKDTKCVLLQNDRDGRKTIATEISNLLYAGENDQQELGKTMLLARNKRTGKVRLIEVDTVEMKPVLKTDLDSIQLQDSSYLELSRKFGSKKFKKFAEQREKFKVNVDAVTEQMLNISQTVTEDMLDLSSYNKNDDESYVPLINREATRVDEVYDTDEILPPELYEKIYEEIEGKEYTADLNPFLKGISNRTLTKKETVLLVYANYLLKLYGTLMKDIVKKNYVLCDHSPTLNDLILKNFLGINNLRRSRTPQMKDKALCHALVFILLINNYKFDFDDLCQKLKLTSRTLASKISVTGASFTTIGSKKIAQLKLPLNKPALRRKSTKF